MTRLIVPPVRLQAGTTWDQAPALLNNNFDQIADSFQGFAVEDVLAFPNNINGFTVGAAGLFVDHTAVVTFTPADDVLFVSPRVSLYIDAPSVPAGSTGFSSDYLYPTGSALTSGQLKTLMSVYVGISSSFTTPSFTGSDGTVYYYTNDMIITVRNADSVSHDYNVVIDQSVYSKDTSVYR